MLVASTGGHKYYQELRGPVLKRAAYCINRCDRGSVESAYKKAWGESFVWTSDEHAFASRCLYRTHSHERDKMEALSEVGLWVGRNIDSNQHLVIPLEAYDSIADEYVLGKVLSVSTVRVFDDQFPLRCIPTGDSDLVKFNDFVDRFDPLYQHAPIEGDGDLEGEYQVKSIIGTRHRGRAKRYITEWEGGAVTIEPESSFDSRLVTEYEDKLRSIEEAHAVAVAHLSEMERMVAELMSKQKVQGELSDWVPGVTDEFDTVTDLRLEAVSEETAQEVLESGNHMKLRMILKEKLKRTVGVRVD